MKTNLSGLLLLAKALSLPDDQPLPNDPMDLLRDNRSSHASPDRPTRYNRSSHASPDRPTRDNSRGHSRGGATRGDGDA